MKYIDVGMDNEDIQNIVAGLSVLRHLLKKQKQYEEADKFRLTLDHLGVLVEDLPNGHYTLKWKE